jgi:hypothetical protein
MKRKPGQPQEGTAGRREERGGRSTWSTGYIIGREGKHIILRNIALAE